MAACSRSAINFWASAMASLFSFLHFFFQLADEVLADLGLLGVDGGFESVGAASFEGLDARLQGLRFRLGGVGGGSQRFRPRRRFFFFFVGPCDQLEAAFDLVSNWATSLASFCFSLPVCY